MKLSRRVVTAIDLTSALARDRPWSDSGPSNLLLHDLELSGLVSLDEGNRRLLVPPAELSLHDLIQTVEPKFLTNPLKRRTFSHLVTKWKERPNALPFFFDLCGRFIRGLKTISIDDIADEERPHRALEREWNAALETTASKFGIHEEFPIL